MKIRHVGDNIVEIDGRVRIEHSPPRKTDIATPELLSDLRTMPHYHLPKKVKVKDLPPALVRADGTFAFVDHTTGATRTFHRERDAEMDVTLVAIDAENRPIQEGKPFTYIDRVSGEKVWNLYVLTPVEETNEKTGAVETRERWLPHGAPFAEEEDAMSAATTLAVEIAQQAGA